MTYQKMGLIIDADENANEAGYKLIYPSGISEVNGRVYLGCTHNGPVGGEFGAFAIANTSDLGFTKFGRTLQQGAVGSVDVSATTIASQAIYFNGKYIRYYAGNGLGGYKVCAAISKDGISWTKYGVVIPKGSAGEVDDALCGSGIPVVFNGKVYLYYIGSDDGTVRRTCLAISKDGINFTKMGVVLPLGGAGEFDTVYTTTASILVQNGRIYLFYLGKAAGAGYSSGLAISKDGINFTKMGMIQPDGQSGVEIDGQGSGCPVVLYKNGRYYNYYMAQTGFADHDIEVVCLSISKTPQGA